MTSTVSRTPKQIQEELATERQELAASVEQLRGELGRATNIADRVGGKLPLLAAGAAGAGFVLGGGVGATMRFLARRSRER